MTINRSLALEFADSIRIGNDFAVSLRDERPNSKDNRLKDIFSPKQTKKSRKMVPENLIVQSIKNKSKSRAHSEALNRNPGTLSG